MENKSLLRRKTHEIWFPIYNERSSPCLCDFWAIPHCTGRSVSQAEGKSIELRNYRLAVGESKSLPSRQLPTKLGAISYLWDLHPSVMTSWKCSVGWKVTTPFGKGEGRVNTRSIVEMHSSEFGLLSCERLLPPTWQRSGEGGGGHLQLGNAAELQQRHTEQHPGGGEEPQITAKAQNTFQDSAPKPEHFIAAQVLWPQWSLRKVEQRQDVLIWGIVSKNPKLALCMLENRSGGRL